MRPAAIALVALAACLALAPSRAVQHGDERHARERGGYFFAFTNGNCTADRETDEISCGAGPAPTVDVVDPRTLQVVSSVALPDDVGPLVWSDAVYIEDCGEGAGYKGYVLANERGGRIIVLDAQAAIAGEADKAVVAAIPMGSRPVHAYAVPHIDGEGVVGEYWSHSDGDGTFDVVKVGNWDDLHAPEIQAHIDTPGHGKLLWDSDLWPYGYASNTREGYLYEIDMRAYNMTRHIKFASQEDDPMSHCVGTHGLAYSKGNGHIYATCTGDEEAGGKNGLVEVNLEGDELVLVKKHEEARGGQVYESSDGEWIVAIDKANDEVVFIDARGAGEASQVAHVVAASEGNCALLEEEKCAGKPDKVAFYDMPDGTVNFFFSFTSPQDKEGGDGVGIINSRDLGRQDTLMHVPGASGAGKYRSIHTGGDYVATIMAHPHEGLMVLRGESGELAGTVETSMKPTRLIYVPDEPTGAYCQQF